MSYWRELIACSTLCFVVNTGRFTSALSGGGESALQINTGVAAVHSWCRLDAGTTSSVLSRHWSQIPGEFYNRLTCTTCTARFQVSFTSTTCTAAATAYMLSVLCAICLSKTVEVRIMQFSPHCSPIPLVFTLCLEILTGSSERGCQIWEGLENKPFAGFKRQSQNGRRHVRSHYWY